MDVNVTPSAKRCTFTWVWSALVLWALSCGVAWASLRYVSPDHPQASDAGEGSIDRPYLSITAAMTRMLPGDTLRIAPGVYRESIIFPPRAWSIDKPTSIIGSDSGTVTLLGTVPVVAWESIGNGQFIRRRWAIEPQQILVNGVMLKQVGGTIFKGYPVQPDHELATLHKSQGGIWPSRLLGTRADMPPGSFLYDAAKRELLIQIASNTLSDSLVEVAVRPYLVQGQNVSGVSISNIRFQFSNTTTTSRQAAVTLIGSGNTLDGLVIEDADGVGIEVSGDENVVRNCRVTRSGFLGIKARGRNVFIENNEISFNNTRRFNKWWEAGGMKFVGGGGLQSSRISNNRVHHNYGDGIWFDWGNDGNRVDHNLSAYNEGFGIQFEASSGGQFLDNQVFGNHQRGIYLIHSRDSIVAHNLVVANGLDGIAVIDEQRSDPKGILDLRPRGNKVFANLVAWNGAAALILPGAEYSNRSDANLYFQEIGSPYFSMGWPKGMFNKRRLSDWQTKERQDQASKLISTAMPDKIKTGFAKENLAIEWDLIAAAVNQFKVPVESLQTFLPTDLDLNTRVGPRR